MNREKQSVTLPKNQSLALKEITRGSDRAGGNQPIFINGPYE